MKPLNMSNTVNLPSIGIGTVKVNNLDTIIPTALKLGYRMIDTAINYGNEAQIGEILAKTKIPRDEIFLISKGSVTTNC